MRSLFAAAIAGFILFAGVEAFAAQGVTQKCGADQACSAQCSAGATRIDEISSAQSFSLTKLKSSQGETTTTIVGIRGAEGAALVVLGGANLSCWTSGMTSADREENPVRQSFIPSSNIECRSESCSVVCYSSGSVLKSVPDAKMVQVNNFFPIKGGPIDPAEREVTVTTDSGGPHRIIGGQEMICALSGF